MRLSRKVKKAAKKFFAWDRGGHWREWRAANVLLFTSPGREYGVWPFHWSWRERYRWMRAERPLEK